MKDAQDAGRKAHGVRSLFGTCGKGGGGAGVQTGASPHPDPLLPATAARSGAAARDKQDGMPRIPKHARKELEAYLDCGLLCRGFARLKCEDCGERRLVAFSSGAFARRARAGG